MDVFRIKDFEISNRLFVGTGKYANYDLMQQALDASRAARSSPSPCGASGSSTSRGRSLLDFLDLERYIDPAQHRRLLHRRGRDPRRRCSGATCWRSTATAARAG